MGLRENDNAQKKLLSAILVFNMLDIVFTVAMIELGFAVEANPFMLSLLEKSHFLFAFVKISLVSLCIYLLWKLRNFKIARQAATLCFLIYGLLICYHIFGVIVSFWLL